MSKSAYRNADTDSIDTQLGHDLRSPTRRTLEGMADAGYTMVRGVGKTVAMTFAIAVGGTIALVAGTKLTSELPADEQPVDLEIFMQQYGIKGTPEEFIDKLLKDGMIDPSLIPHAQPEGSVEPGQSEQEILPDDEIIFVQPQKTFEI